SYVMQRLAHPEWTTQTAVTNVWFGGFNTFVLLTSSLSAVLAHQAAEHGDGKKAARLLYYTRGGGPTLICGKTGEWGLEIRRGLPALVDPLRVFLLHRRGDPRAARDRRWDHHAVRRRRCQEEPRAPPRGADRDLLALRRHRLDLPVPAALHREVTRHARHHGR